ncbi:MAG: hypothetical protein ACRCYP_01650 [Alphaproteobacteria bacterium]
MVKKKHISELKITDKFHQFASLEQLPKGRRRLSFEELKAEMGADYETMFALTAMIWEQRGIIDKSLGKPIRFLSEKKHRRVLSWVLAGADPDVAVKKALVDLEKWDLVNKKKLEGRQPPIQNRAFTTLQSSEGKSSRILVKNK